ncbi:arylesterase [Undibacterium fentianense]|uniref:Arylesterase n=1 Tax=Undibacterium fentianense TaxID=2828728 RepID=A0A941DY97_9BURK|nr:arylesterase [Undibacterium fentianense]MBR7798980.1 arylesterase [Undibacterium fentianense]
MKTLNFFRRLTLLLVLGVFASNAYSAPKTILVLGDSLSAEYGLARGSGWVALLEARLAAKKYSYQVINASISGETSSGGKSRLGALLNIHQPEIVIIELGGNDALRGLDLNESEQNFRDMLNMATAKKAKTLLVAMQIPPNYGRAYTEKFFSMYAKLAKENKSAIVPFFLKGVAEKNELFQADRIHPTAKAHPTMLDNVWEPLQKMLKR